MTLNGITGLLEAEYFMMFINNFIGMFYNERNFFSADCNTLINYKRDLIINRLFQNDMTHRAQGHGSGTPRDTARPVCVGNLITPAAAAASRSPSRRAQVSCHRMSVIHDS